MPQNLLACHGALGLVCAVGGNGRIVHFEGDVYRAKEVQSPMEHDLRGVFVESPHRAWAVGDAGTILRYDGERWHPVALASRVSALTCIWGHPSDGISIGGRRYLLNMHPTHDATLIDSDADLRAIWGRHPEDVWYVCGGRLALHWGGERAERIDLPGDDDEEWSAVAGTDDGLTYIVGVSGCMLRTDGRRWEEIATDTTELLTGAVCVGRSLYVTTDGGMVRQWDGRRWRTVAFSAFGALHAVCHVDGVIWACGDRCVVIQHRPDEGGR